MQNSGLFRSVGYPSASSLSLSLSRDARSVGENRGAVSSRAFIPDLACLRETRAAKSFVVYYRIVTRVLPLPALTPAASYFLL